MLKILQISSPVRSSSFPMVGRCVLIRISTARMTLTISRRSSLNAALSRRGVERIRGVKQYLWIGMADIKDHESNVEPPNIRKHTECTLDIDDKFINILQMRGKCGEDPKNKNRLIRYHQQIKRSFLYPEPIAKNSKI